MTAKQAIGLAALVLFVAMPALSVLVPTNLGSRGGWILSVIQSVNSLTGAGEQMASFSSFPDRTRTVFAILWIGSIAFMIAIYRGLLIQKHAVLVHFREIRGKLVFLLPLAAYALVYFPMTLHIVTPTLVASRRSSGFAMLQWASHDPIGLGIVAAFLGFLPTIFVPVLLFCVRYFREIFFRGS